MSVKDATTGAKDATTDAKNGTLPEALADFGQKGRSPRGFSNFYTRSTPLSRKIRHFKTCRTDPIVALATIS